VTTFLEAVFGVTPPVKPATPAPLPVPAEVPILAGEVAGNFSIAAASIQGPSHRSRGVPGDDRFAWKVQGDRICAIVCDGAGSAELGRVGAERASVDLASDLINAMANNPLSAETVRGAVAASISALTRQLLQRYPQNQVSDFHATVVGAIWDEAGCVLFHIGDGVAAGLPRSAALPTEPSTWAKSKISEPQNGESEDQTFFFTMTPLALRVTEVGPVDAVALMSDGAASLAYTKADKTLEGGLFGPVSARWAEVLDCTKVAGLLADVMMADEARAISEDDKCLLIAIRRGPEVAPKI